MQNRFDAAPGAKPAALAATAEKAAEVLAFGLQEDQRGQGYSEDNLNNAEIGCLGLQIHGDSDLILVVIPVGPG